MNQFQNHLPDAINASPSCNFTQVPNDILRSKTLGMKGKCLLMLLLSNTEGWTSFIETIKSMIKEGSESIMTGLKELEDLGYLWRIQYRNKETKSRVGSFWAYTTTPFDFKIKSHLEFLDRNGFEIWLRKEDEKWKTDYLPKNKGIDPNKAFPDKAFPDKAFPVLRITRDKNTKEDKNKNMDFFEINKPKEKSDKYFIKQLPTPYQQDKEFITVWKEYIDDRKKTTLHGVTRIINDMRRSCRSDIAFATRCIETCVKNGWTGIRFDKEKHQKQERQWPKWEDGIHHTDPQEYADIPVEVMYNDWEARKEQKDEQKIERPKRRGSSLRV